MNTQSAQTPNDDILHFFTAQKVPMSDGSDFWEIVTSDGDRIASTDIEQDALSLEMQLNMICSDFISKPGFVFNV